MVRRTGLAVENTFSTTVFIGQSTVTANAHIACSIDDGNIDKTDVAFVGEEYPDDNGYAIKLADVILHEAGHTFGLYHVASGNDTESMGLRYNTPSSLWTQDTSFRDQAYRVIEDHGPDIMQNSHRYMLQTFVAGIVAIPGVVGNGGITSNRVASSVTTSAASSSSAKSATAPYPPEEGRAEATRKDWLRQLIDWADPEWLKAMRAVEYA